MRQSTDDFDVQANIRYDVYLNGVLEDVRFGSGGPITAYGVFGENPVEVIASDTAGNASAAGHDYLIHTLTERSKAGQAKRRRKKPRMLHNLKWRRNNMTGLHFSGFATRVAAVCVE